MANEIVREFKTALFYGASDQTEYSGLCEGILVMHLLAINDLAQIEELRVMSREERHRHVLTFALLNEEEIARIKPEVERRIECAMAASVESEAGGKPLSQARDSSRV